MTEVVADSKILARKWTSGSTRHCRRVEEEVKKVIAYLNDQVVPQLRQDSSQALHAAADRLRKLAEQLDDRRGAH